MQRHPPINQDVVIRVTAGILPDLDRNVPINPEARRDQAAGADHTSVTQGGSAETTVVSNADIRGIVIDGNAKKIQTRPRRGPLISGPRLPELRSTLNVILLDMIYGRDSCGRHSGLPAAAPAAT